MSWIAPLYVAWAAAELPAPSHGAARKPSWNGSSAMSFWKSSPALTKHGSDQSPVVTALSMPGLAAVADREVCPVEGAGPGVLAGEGDRGDALVLERLDGRQELVPRRRQGRDAGILKALVLYQKPDEAEVERHAVVLAVDLVHAEGAGVDRVLPRRAMSAVMSLTRPASTCWRRPPPPHVWNRSGTSPCWRSVVSLVLNASFSRTWMSIVTLGWAAVYSSASFFHRLRPGSLFWMWYQVIVTGSRSLRCRRFARGAGGCRWPRRSSVRSTPLRSEQAANDQRRCRRQRGDPSVGTSTCVLAPPVPKVAKS